LCQKLNYLLHFLFEQLPIIKLSHLIHQLDQLVDTVKHQPFELLLLITFLENQMTKNG